MFQQDSAHKAAHPTQRSIALRDVGQRLDEQEIELKNQQTSLTNSINRLRSDIKDLLQNAKDGGPEVPEADFPLEELDEEEELSDDE